MVVIWVTLLFVVCLICACLTCVLGFVAVWFSCVCMLVVLVNSVD